MQLSPLEAQGTQAGKAAPEEKKDPGAGFSEALALALGQGLSLFGPKGQGGAESQESLLEALDENEEATRATDEAEATEAPEEAEPERSREAEAARGEAPEETAERAESSGPTKNAESAAGRLSTALAPGAAIPLPAGAAGKPLESLAGAVKAEAVAATASRARPAAGSDLAGRVTRILQVMKRDGETLFRGTLRLAQGELGPLRVDLEMKDDSLSVRFLVAGEEARQALEAQLEKLRESLQGQGFSNLEITVELGESSADEAWGSESPEPGPGEEAGEDSPSIRAESRWEGLLDLLA